jgi:hypothetical protein
LNYNITAEHFAVNHQYVNHPLPEFSSLKPPDSSGIAHSSGIHILHRGVALEALYDSAESFPQPKCHPKTRKKLLNQLYHWATNPDSTNSIQWLHGPAGAGKSAVMQTLCQQLRDAGQLCGSFFFKRDHSTRGNARVLFATLAYQLALHHPELKSPISQCVEADPSVVARGMDVQLRTLIIEPCKLLESAPPSVLLIDGLDECEGHDIQQEILRLIGSTARNRHFHILVASRPEPHIREIFEDESFQGLCYSTNIDQSFEDVRKYLQDEFSRIHRKHRTMQNIEAPWPSPEILEMLIRKSSGYFIYASTVIKFVDDEYSRPSKQLDIIQNFIPHDTGSPFEALDQLYIQILMGVPARYRHQLCEILSVFIHYPVHTSPREIDALLGFQSGDVSLILRPLHSVLKLHSEELVIGVHHASFYDFLQSQRRASIFYVGSRQHRVQLAQSILKALAYTYDDRQKNQAMFRWYVHKYIIERQLPGFNYVLCRNLPSDSGACHWIDYVTSVPSSVEFAPLVQCVNPDFIFVKYISNATLHKFLSWLKVCLHIACLYCSHPILCRKWFLLLKI